MISKNNLELLDESPESDLKMISFLVTHKLISLKTKKQRSSYKQLIADFLGIYFII